MSVSSYQTFNLDDPALPRWIEDAAFSSADYPYPDKMKRKPYEADLHALQCQLVLLQAHIRAQGERLLILFEGRDAAGKGGTIHRFRQHLNPRHARAVALSKPTERERGEWYFQRYVAHFPTAGEIVLFDRSWYNRGVVEPVMGFCTPEETRKFLADAPQVEKTIKDEGIHFFKFWLNIGREMQVKRFHDRRHDPLKTWKLSPVDLAALERWDAYTEARNRMIAATHSAHAPWTIVRANDKRRARVNAIRHVLTAIDYAGKDSGAIGMVDRKIIGSGPGFLD